MEFKKVQAKSCVSRKENLKQKFIKNVISLRKLIKSSEIKRLFLETV